MQEGEREELIRVARGDIPARYAHPLWVTVAPDGSRAVVVLGVNEEPYLDVEESRCFRRDGRWHSVGSGNGLGFGWTPHVRVGDGTTFLGLLQLGGEAPVGVERVVIRWNGDDHAVPVTTGYYFFGVWDVPEDFDDSAGYPRVVRYLRADGTSETAPADPYRERAWAFERVHRESYLRRARWQIALHELLERLRSSQPPSGAPATGAEVGGASETLGVKLPSSYWMFATTFASGALLYGIEEVVGPNELGSFSWRYSSDADPDELVPFADGGEANLWGLVPFHRDRDGNSWCFVSAGELFEECPVAYFDVANRMLIARLEGGFAEWLRILIDERREVIRSIR